MSGVNPGVIASNLKRIGKQTLVGYVDIEVPAWRIRFKGCLWHQKGDKEWIAFPSREWLRDGQRQFADIVEITDRNVRDCFQRAPLDAVHQLGRLTGPAWRCAMTTALAAQWTELPEDFWTDPGHADPLLDPAYRSGIMPPAPGDDGWDTITVLRARGRRLAKVVVRDGSITGYDAAKYFDLTEVPVDGLDHLEEDLRRLLHQPDRCIVRGQIADPARVTGVRRLLHPDGPDPATLVEVPRRWLALDIDGIARPANVAAADLVACAGIAIAALPPEFHGARCLAQATASHGIKPGLRLRLWFWLDRPVSTAELKRWLPPALVDHAVFSAAQITYTAAPIFAGASDPLPARLVRSGAGTACVSVPDLPEPEKPRSPPPVTPAIGLSRYGEVALDNIGRRIISVPEGERDRAINSGAYSAGQLAGAGVVPHGFSLRVVHYAAARGVPGYSQRDRSKVERSFANGVRNPRKVRP